MAFVKYFNIFKKKNKKIDLIKMHILNNQYRGVIGWVGNDEKTLYPSKNIFSTSVLGYDNFKRDDKNVP